MATSGTYDFNPSLGEIVLYAYHLLGTRSTALTQEHMFDARMAANLLGLDWTNEGVNLWKVDLVTVPFVQGQPTYSVPPETALVLDVYITQTNSAGVNIDRVVLPVSRSEYASYPNKLQQGAPTVWWFDRLISPTITFWPAPDGVTAQQFSYYRVSRIQDGVLAGGATMDIVNRFIPAFVDGMAFQLSRSWAPSRMIDLKMQAAETLTKAKGQDVERGNVYIGPMLSGYYRN
jgi:hypothetical protein